MSRYEIYPSIIDVLEMPWFWTALPSKTNCLVLSAKCSNSPYACNMGFIESHIAAARMDPAVNVMPSYMAEPENAKVSSLPGQGGHAFLSLPRACLCSSLWNVAETETNGGVISLKPLELEHCSPRSASEAFTSPGFDPNCKVICH